MSGQGIQQVNANADILKKEAATQMNINAARGLHDVLKSNLGPTGTMKMLVSGGGEIKLTKDGNTLLHEMQIQNPTACMIARIATAQDDITGDGTTSNVLIIGDLMKHAERYLSDGVHPRVLCEGIELAKIQVAKIVEEFKIKKDTLDRNFLIQVAAASLRTKLHEELADHITEVVVDAVLCIRHENEPIDLHMVEILHMQHKTDLDTRLVKGLVLDHGGRHPDMPKKLTNCKILILNAGLEYEKSEVNSGFFYSSAEQREKMVDAERRWVAERCDMIINFKREVCKDGESFMVINQKGIDPLALDLLAAEGILGLRRAKRRNMERLALACGGESLNNLDVESLKPEVLGWADSVYEQTLGEDMFTFVEGCRNAQSCTILVKGAHPHVIAQIKDALRDGLRAVVNAVEDGYMLPGAGAFEIAAHARLEEYRKTIKGRAKLGVQAYADALLVIPKSLAENGGYDGQDTIIKLQESAGEGNWAGINLKTGEAMDPTVTGVWDNWRVKHQMLDSSAVITTQLLLVDEVIRAGKQMGGNKIER